MEDYSTIYHKKKSDGNLVKLPHLQKAYELKNKIAGGRTNSGNKIVRLQRNFLNTCITDIQKHINDGNMPDNIDDLASKMADEISNIEWKNTELMKDPNNKIEIKELTKLVKEFINEVMCLAKHATNSNTKTNWFGFTNETSNIQLLKHGEDCERYLEKMESQGYIQKEKNVKPQQGSIKPVLEESNNSSISNPSHEIIWQQRMKTQKEYELEAEIDHVNAIVMSLGEISDSPALRYQDNQVLYSSIKDDKDILIPSHTNGSLDLQLFRKNVLENISPNIGTTKEKLIKAMSSTLNNDFPLFETEVSTKINQKTIELSGISIVKSEIEQDISKLKLFMTDDDINFVTFYHYPSLECDHSTRYGSMDKTVEFNKKVMEQLQILNQDFINKGVLLNQELRNLKQELIAIKVGEYFLLESKPNLNYL